MKIIIHRGTHQIGGCATEIKTNKNRIIIDAGAELDGNAPLTIPGVTEGKSDCDAVLFTHYHGDHIGLMESIHDDIPLYMSELSIDILKLQNDRQQLFDANVVSRIEPYFAAKELTFGDIKVTPFMVDHSAFDSHMFLIEADGKRVLHTGDFRLHGFRGKGLIPTLKKYIGEVDALICEGTTLNRSSSPSMTEYELSQKARQVLRDNKYVLIACASTNFDRIAAICSAVPYGKYCLCDEYQKSLLDTVSEHSGKYSQLYQFPKMLTYSDKLLHKMEKQGFCMFIRPGNYLSDRLLTKFKDKNPLIVYSMWSGYLEDERMKRAVSGYRMEILHTSGHADRKTIEAVVRIVKPSVIIPIHTESPLNFPCGNANTLNVTDGQEIDI